MANYYVKAAGGSAAGVDGTHRGYWAPSTAYAVGDRVSIRQSYNSQAARTRMYECTTAGTTGVSDPAWNTTNGGTTTSGTAVFTTRVPNTWANAHISCYMVISGSLLSGNDTLWVDSTLDETATTALNVAYSGGIAFQDIKILSTDDLVNEPPTTLAVGAKMSVGSLAFTWNINNNAPTHYWGIYFKGSTSASFGGFQASGPRQRFDKCTFEFPAGASASATMTGNTNGLGVVFRDCTFSFSNASQRFNLGATFENCTVTGTALSGLVTAVQSPVKFIGCDLSNMQSSFNILANGNYCPTDLINCKFPANWSGTGITGNTSDIVRWVRVINCDSGDTTYKFSKYMPNGSQVVETTLVRTGGASDGTTPISWKVVTNSSTTNDLSLMALEPILAYISDVGSSKTLTVELLHDSVTGLTDAEVILDVMAMSTSGVPLGTWVTTRLNPIATGSALASSSATWTTTGMTNPNKQKISVTFTPQEVGFVLVQLYIKKTSKTLYICPKVTVA